MSRLTDPLISFARWLRTAVGRVLEVAGEYALELVGGTLLVAVIGYGVFGPSNVLLLQVGSTVVSAPAWVVSLLVTLVFAVVFWLIVSQLED